MARSSSNHYARLLLLAAAAAVAALLAPGEASGVGFNLHHRFSPVVRRWAEARGHPAARWPQPRQGSPEYYAALSRHDRALFARRSLAEGGGGGLLTFADGNATFRYYGSLHYAEVALGTPNTTFLVALDTGSDLFWVPCDCKRCAPLGNLTSPSEPPLRPYSPRQSSTSKTVGCDHALCERRTACRAASNSSCPYTVRYASANTSSSGFLVEDVLYLTRETPGVAGEAVKAPVVFGCGQEQTGQFLDGGAPDGLMGLGMGATSVPSVLAGNGSGSGLVASNSFSMCFSHDGVGRINFGDAGDRGQAETPLIVGDVHPMYNISVTAITVEDKSVAVDLAAVVDSGTSFTYLNDPAYTQLATNFNSQIREKRANYSNGSVPFEYCYELSPSQDRVLIPDVSLTTKGGAVFPVTRPFVLVVDVNATGQADRVIGYCLAVIKSDISIDVIGQNFMTGLKVVFDRERAVLGWEKFDCYKNERMADAPGPAPGPAEAAPFKPKVTDVTNGYPGAAPVPRPTGSAGHAGGRTLGGRLALIILLPLLHLLLA